MELPNKNPASWMKLVKQLGEHSESYHKILGQWSSGFIISMWVFPKIGDPKMDGENNGNPYFLMDDLGGYPPIFGNIHVLVVD